MLMVSSEAIAPKAPFYPRVVTPAQQQRQTPPAGGTGNDDTFNAIGVRFAADVTICLREGTP
jgi:hypothetical protein